MTALAVPAKNDLGRMLLDQGLCSPAQLRHAQEMARQTGDRLVPVLSRLGICADDALTASLSAWSGCTVLDPAQARIWDPARGTVTREFMDRHGIVPAALDGTLIFAVADPSDLFPVTALERLLGPPHAVMIAGIADIRGLIQAYFAETAHTAQTGGAERGRDDAARLTDARRDEPAIRLVDDLVAAAVRDRASDIHIEPQRDKAVIRRRIDGTLTAWQDVDAKLAPELAARLKVLARLDVAERRLPQDGRCRLSVRGKAIDLRVSILPTLFGESVVLRVLDKSAQAHSLTDLGFSPHLQDGLADLARLRHGLVLVAGPTGSGKTTTLYALLRQADDGARKIVTVEDPVEFDLPGTNQIQVQPTIGLDFARVLRSVLRHDPDIIMIGEIRDAETARIAVQAALTGHLVLATVHTNGAVESVARLTDMGIEPYLLAATLRGAFSQRLVRRLCACAQTQPVPQSARALFDGVDPPPEGLRVPVGCAACGQTGYRGRLPIGELLIVDDTLRGQIADGLDASRLEQAARAGGLRLLHQDGLMRVAAGETALADLTSGSLEL